MARFRSRGLVFLPLVVLALLVGPVAQPQAGLISSLLNTVTRLVNGALGAVLTNGMWTVQVPPDAFSGTASISISVSASAPRTCLLDISPADKNSFSRPVTLTARLPLGTATSDTRIEWFDPQTRMWVPVPGSTVDLARSTVSAPLMHFSEYRVGGRSGW